MNPEDCYKRLFEQAKEARKKAYCPYSHFAVGAALLCVDGSIFTGCNIENAAYSPSNCAERTALFKAISEGQRTFCAIAIAGGKENVPGDAPCWPCGVCRQVLSEFCKSGFEILLVTDGGYEAHTLGELLPLSFEFTGE